MAIQSAPQTGVQCDHTECETTGEKWEFIGEYCSHECKHRARGWDLLKTIKYEHTICNACFTKLKTLERPTDEQKRNIQGDITREALVGYQYTTKEADIGEKVAREDTYNQIRTGVICGNCGTTDHRDSFRRDANPKEAAKRLRKRIQELRTEGKHDYTFRTKIFVEAWNDSHDWVLSVGRAISTNE